MIPAHLLDGKSTQDRNEGSPTDYAAQNGTFKVVFLGTGVSTAMPNLGHILADSCDVCRDANTKPGSKNKRSNVSIAIIFKAESLSDSDMCSAIKEKCVLIDVGKTMREACLSILPRHGIKEVAGIVLTHGHADAILGLDDVRDLQISKAITISNPAVAAASLACQCCIQQSDGNRDAETVTCNLCTTTQIETLDVTVTGFKVISGAMPIYLHRETMDVVERTFAYLTQSPDYLDENTSLLSRRIALLKFTVIEQDDYFSVCGLPMRSFPVYHGGKYVSLGFSIGKEGEFVYISDVKIIPESTMAYLKGISRIKTLVVDALSRDGVWSHMGIEEALSLVQTLQPDVAYFTGMCCQMGLHADVEAELLSRAPHTHLAYDGLELSGYHIC